MGNVDATMDRTKVLDDCALVAYTPYVCVMLTVEYVSATYRRYEMCHSLRNEGKEYDDGGVSEGNAGKGCRQPVYFMT